MLQQDKADVFQKSGFSFYPRISNYQEEVFLASDFNAPHNVCSVPSIHLGDIMMHVGDIMSTGGGGGGGCAVPWGYHDACGDIMNTVGGVQCLGEISWCMWGISWVPRGMFISCDSGWKRTQWLFWLNFEHLDRYEIGWLCLWWHCT